MAILSSNKQTRNMSIIDTLRPKTEDQPIVDIKAIRRKLGEAGVGRMFINNREGAPTEVDPVTGQRRTFAQLNYELALRNERINLHPLPGGRLPVDDETNIEVLENMYPEDAFKFSKR